jgi:uncharacterized membrane protein (UPF0127 family)
MRFWRLRAFVAAFLALLGTALLAPSLGPAVARAEVLQSLEIVTASGPHQFKVELADEPSERAKGLMFRRSMPPNQGMLFDFHDEVPIMMWMKNTYIPLDMVFVSRDGTVTSVAPNAVPMSEETIPGGMAYGVIELNAGVAEKIGLKPGDVVHHPAFRH